MKIRRVDVDCMRRYSAKTTPDQITKIITREEAANFTTVNHLFKNWMDKMRIKHLGKRRRIELFQEHDIKNDTIIMSARVVEDPYAQPI